MQNENSCVINVKKYDAEKFFLRNESYFSIGLPNYFDWQGLLKKTQQMIKETKTGNFISKATEQETINYLLYANKDGNYAWRKLEIMHPVMYVCLVNLVIENWEKLQKRFEKFAENEKIKCVSIPVYNKDGQSKGKQINKWYTDFEQESIKQAIKFKYMYKTDITDCYGSIYTHTIAWACVGKDEAKKK